MKQKFENGEKTEVARLLISDDEFPNFQSICEWLKEPGIFPDFYCGIKNFLKERGLDYLDDKSLFKYIKKSVEDNEVELSDSTLRTFRNWIIEKKGIRINPQANSTSRENIYLLCFALGMTYDEAVTFFCHVYLCRPFDCRNMDEAIYLFCFKENRKYSDYKRIKECINNKQCDRVKEGLDSTMAFISKIELIENEDEFINFTANNAFFDQSSNVTALDQFDRLLEVAKEIAEVNSISSLYQIIVGMSYRKVTREKTEDKEHKALLRNSSQYPKMIRSNFPKEQNFSDLKNRKQNVTYDTVRKVLILLKFYIYSNDMNNWGMFEDFMDETNDLLRECGYPILYYRNPYDWLILRCISTYCGETTTKCEEKRCEEKQKHGENKNPLNNSLDPLTEFQEFVRDMINAENKQN